MPRKPNSMYREIRGQAYTRKEYMGGIPGLRISQWDIGDLRTEFPLKLHLIAKEQCQIRHTALEAARISANRYIAKKAGNAYHLKLRLYPHNVLRENKMKGGPGTGFSRAPHVACSNGRNGPPARGDHGPRREDRRPPVPRRTPHESGRASAGGLVQR